MKRSTTSRFAFAFVGAMPLLPVCGFVLNVSPAVVFSIGATVFFIDVLLLVWLLAAISAPVTGSSPAAKRFRFTIRDLLCLTVFSFGMTIFIVSAFKCEAAERLSRPGPLPAAVFRQFVWEQASGLVCVTIGGLIWIRSALNRPKEITPCDSVSPSATFSGSPCSRRLSPPGQSITSDRLPRFRR